jgi:hypothetical protein
VASKCRVIPRLLAAVDRAATEYLHSFRMISKNGLKMGRPWRTRGLTGSRLVRHGSRPVAERPCSATSTGRESVPVGEYKCNFGRWGWLGRSLRDANLLVLSRLAAVVLMLVALSIATTVFIVVQPGHSEGDLGKILTVLEGIGFGSLIGLAFVAVWSALPRSRRSHWCPRHAPYTVAQNIFWVESRHWHTARNLRCEIRCPNGEKRVVSAAMPYEVLAPKHTSAQIELPPYGPGKYRLRWIIDAEDRSNPIVIAKDTWREGLSASSTHFNCARSRLARAARHATIRSRRADGDNP